MVRIGSTMAEQLVQGGIEEESGRITAGQFYTAVALLLRSANIAQQQSGRLKEACPALARKSADEVFEPAGAQFRLLVDTYSVNWGPEHIQERLDKDEFFSKWPPSMKDRFKRKK
jgi:hypothetical protein